MKLIINVTILCFIFFSCSKDAASLQTEPLLSGKWKIVNDSSASSIGIMYSHRNYIGMPGDYFDFKQDGKLYVKEGSLTYTLQYQLFPQNKIAIEGFGMIINNENIKSDIIHLTSHSVTIATIPYNTPGGSSARMVNLRR